MARFFKWLKNEEDVPISSKRKNTFNQLKTIWQVSALIQKAKKPHTQREWLRLESQIQVRENQKAIRTISWGRYKPAIAGVFLLLVVIGSVIFYQNQFIRYRTQRGDQISIYLPDSSRIFLNAETQITINRNFNQTKRHVRLSGEAYFEVRQGVSPFQIQTDVGLITVIGTKFNVHARDKMMDVIVNQGIVQVASVKTESQGEILLTKGQMTRIAIRKEPSPPFQAPFDTYPGWLQNKLMVHRMPAYKVLGEIERRFDVHIHFMDKDIGNIEISGVFETTDIETVMASLCTLIGREYQQKEKSIEII